MKKSLLIAAAIVAAGLIVSTVVWRRTAVEQSARNAAFAENMKRVVRRDEIAVAVHSLNEEIARGADAVAELRRIADDVERREARNDTDSAITASKDIKALGTSLTPALLKQEVERIESAHKAVLAMNAETRKRARDEWQTEADRLAALRQKRILLITEAESLALPVGFIAKQ